MARWSPWDGRVARCLNRPAAPATAPVRRWRRSRPAGCAGRATRGLQRDAVRSTSSSAAVKPPSGPTSSAAGPAGRALVAHPAARSRRPAVARRASRRAGRPAGAARSIRGTVSRSHCSAASMAMARSRSRLTRAALVRAVITGSKRRDAEFGGLFHHQVGGVALEQGEAPATDRAPPAAARRSGASTPRRARSRRSATMRACHSPSAPLNSRSVSPTAAPHHGAEVMGLRGAGVELAAGPQRGGDEQAD